MSEQAHRCGDEQHAHEVASSATARAIPESHRLDQDDACEGERPEDRDHDCRGARDEARGFLEPIGHRLGVVARRSQDSFMRESMSTS